MLTLYDLIISSSSTLQTALERMTKNKKGLLFICDQDAHLIGVISDGDIRRALVGNALLISSVESFMNLDPIVARSKKEAMSLLANRSLLAVPVLDAKGKIVCAIIEGINQTEVITFQVEESNIHSSTESTQTIAIIPARGGSKRISRKNIALLAGKPLLAYAIESAQNSRFVFKVIVSTDDAEIADVARRYGADVPWMRPAPLAQDNTPSIDVVLHAVEWAVGIYGNQVQYGLLLEPTAPLRTSRQIDQALEMLQSSDADSVVSVCQLPHVFNPAELLVIQDGMLKSYDNENALDTRKLRDTQSPVYVQNGLVYAFKLKTVIEKKSIYGDKALPMLVDWEYFLDIDVPADLMLAEFKIRQSR